MDTLDTPTFFANGMICCLLVEKNSKFYLSRPDSHLYLPRDVDFDGQRADLDITYYQQSFGSSVVFWRRDHQFVGSRDVRSHVWTHFSIPDSPTSDVAYSILFYSSEEFMLNSLVRQDIC